jgi:hypothetical protein
MRFIHNPYEEKDICSLLGRWHSSCVTRNATIAQIFGTLSPEEGPVKQVSSAAVAAWYRNDAASGGELRR